MGVPLETRVQNFKCVRCEWCSSFSLLGSFDAHKVRERTVAHFKTAAGRNYLLECSKDSEGRGGLYLPFASFIHCSRTGLIFWALLGVMSSFSNLHQEDRDQTLASGIRWNQGFRTTYQRFIKWRDCTRKGRKAFVVVNARTFFSGALRKNRL